MFHKSAAAAAIFICFLAAPPRLAAQEFDYRPYAEALKTAENGQKKVMIFFWADWCKFCDKIRREVFSDPKIHAAFNRDFIAVSVNIDRDPDGLARKYQARALPTLTFLDAQGEVMAYWEGAADQRTFLEMLKILSKESL